MLCDLLRVEGPGVWSPCAVRPAARTRTWRSESKCSAICCAREDPEFRDVGTNTSRPCNVGMCVHICLRPSSVTDICNNAYCADRLQHQMSVFYIYCKHLYVIKSTAYYDNAVAEVHFNPIYTNRASVPLHRLHHASLDTDEATDAGGMTRFGHVLPAHGSVWPWICRRHTHLHQHTSMEK